MTIPTVHLNGTGKKNLLEELQTAHAKVNEAIDALGQVTVHGRDYYVQGPDAYRQARHEMNERIAALDKVQEELLAMHVAIQQQGKEQAMRIDVKVGRKEGFESSFNLFFENGLKLKTDDLTFASSESKRTTREQFEAVIAALIVAGFDVRGKL